MLVADKRLNLNYVTDFDCAEGDTTSPLHSATMFCYDPEIIKALLANGADKTIVDSESKTPYQSFMEMPLMLTEPERQKLLSKEPYKSIFELLK